MRSTYPSKGAVIVVYEKLVSARCKRDLACCTCKRATSASAMACSRRIGEMISFSTKRLMRSTSTSAIFNSAWACLWLACASFTSSYNSAEESLKSTCPFFTCSPSSTRTASTNPSTLGFTSTNCTACTSATYDCGTSIVVVVNRITGVWSFFPDFFSRFWLQDTHTQSVKHSKGK